MSYSDILYNVIKQLKDEPSRNAKERILMKMKDSTTFKKILYHTYNPYLTYHIRKIPTKLRGRGYGEIRLETWALLTSLANRKITGNVARETLFEYIESLSPAAARIVILVVKRDLKIGIAAKTINKIIPDLIPYFECQLVEDWEEARVRYPILVGPKLDGVRGEKRASNIVTRRGHKIVGLDHILSYMKSIGTHMDTSGELWIPGMKFHRASGVIRSNKASKPNVKYAVFDILSLAGMPLDQRLKYLSKTFYPLESQPLPPVCYVPHILVDNKEEVDKLYNYWRSRGYEGLVGKDPNGFIKMGKSFQWMRKVALISAEYKILDVYESDENPGTLGGIVIEGNIRVGGGFTDDERIKYFETPELIRGKYATIEAKEKTKSGDLRQAVYKEIRWDI